MGRSHLPPVLMTPSGIMADEGRERWQLPHASVHAAPQPRFIGHLLRWCWRLSSFALAPPDCDALRKWGGEDGGQWPNAGSELPRCTFLRGCLPRLPRFGRHCTLLERFCCQRLMKEYGGSAGKPPRTPLIPALPIGHRSRCGLGTSSSTTAQFAATTLWTFVSTPPTTPATEVDAHTYQALCLFVELCRRK